jgi:hypothetical protein
MANCLKQLTALRKIGLPNVANPGNAHTFYFVECCGEWIVCRALKPSLGLKDTPELFA